mmetsp:Transcript_9402/g.26837  ORF Transcript_9402/g.26837 Transcript_9402/m.26837 type:complete len:178 (-) Transcript_9402:21-554(-)
MITSYNNPNQLDILLGRGKANQDHVGNKRLRDVCSRYRDEFQAASPNHSKKAITERALHEIECGILGLPPVRFMERQADASWAEAGREAAMDKVHHVLRDKKRRRVSEADRAAIQAAIDFEKAAARHEDKCFHTARIVPADDAAASLGQAHAADDFESVLEDGLLLQTFLHEMGIEY